MSKIDKIMGEGVGVDVQLDTKAVQECIQQALTTLAQMVKFGHKLGRRAEEIMQEDAESVTSPAVLVKMQANLASASGHLSKTVDQVFRLAEFSQGKADSRPDMQISTRQLLENVSDDLLAQFKREIDVTAQVEEADDKGYVN